MPSSLAGNTDCPAQNPPIGGSVQTGPTVLWPPSVTRRWRKSTVSAGRGWPARAAIRQWKPTGCGKPADVPVRITRYGNCGCRQPGPFHRTRRMGNGMTSLTDGIFKIRDIAQNEFGSFFKDDWKVTRDLTLNLGVRWDYYGVPWERNGLTTGLIGGGTALFGISGRSFDDWMKPGARAPTDGAHLCGAEFAKP